MRQNTKIEAGKAGDFMVGCIGWVLIGPLFGGVLFYLNFFLTNLFHFSTGFLWPIILYASEIMVLLYLGRSWIKKGKWVLYGAMVTMLVNILGLLVSFKMYDYFVWENIILFGPFMPFFVWLMPNPS